MVKIMSDLKKYIRSVADFPKPGILYYDITTLLQDPSGFNLAILEMEKYVKQHKPNKLVAIESRGYLFAAVLAHRLGLPLVLVRKPGKLPHKTISEAYELEYGNNCLEIHLDAITAEDRVVIIDDLLATGGTVQATINLVERLQGMVVGICGLIGLSFLSFKQRLANYNVHYLIDYDV